MEKFWAIFYGVRKVVCFILGILVTLDAITDRSDTVAKLLVGAILIGILPVEDILPWKRKTSNLEIRS